MNGPDDRPSRAELDREYSPSHLVPSLGRYLDEYAARSAEARRAPGVRTGLRYGPGAADRLDFWPAPSGPAPVQIFVHGGNWQELTERSSAFSAPAFCEAGAAFAAVGYGLAPGTPLDGIVAAVRRCVRWIHDRADDLGVDPRRMHLSGTSAGAHLAAMTMVPEEPGEPPAADLLAGVTLLSGIYDLEPVSRCYVNDALRLDEDAVRRNSPVGLLPATAPPVVLARGGVETGEYVRQHDLMAAALRRRGALAADIVEGDRDHFDLPYDLADPSTPLGRAVLEQMGLADDERGQRPAEVTA
ncbi:MULTISPECIES: alpha/beta hydrolase [Streptomyces]|uniref:Alpha/beta hydrolase n=1 Tax=Streptomyces lienomycini TaxID=284035 RepID=A0ABV9WLK3_9ACTN|nr:alpha/beta hydrolase [Streptomyces lienomycini]